MNHYVLAADQSTQGTKGLLFDAYGMLIARADRPHRQLIDSQGWISHDLNEIRRNTLAVCREAVEKSGVDKAQIAAFAITNQRETTAAWDKLTGEPACEAIVWQCARAARICDQIACQKGLASIIKERTGLPLSPYFPAAKMAWLLENRPTVRLLAEQGRLAFGTIDSWLISFLCQGSPHKTDYSNASRTQLYDITRLSWDAEICRAFGIPMDTLPEVCMSDSLFGYTDLDGWLETPIPVHGVLGDSHGALFGQDCRSPGRIKATYGTGSSVMMHVGDNPVFSQSGLVTSLAWGMDGKVQYVFEGNLNYTGAVITWLKNDVGLITSDAEATALAREANPEDKAYFVPAFTGLGAPHWDSHATGMFTGITRTTGRKEIAKACLECIAYQITDLVKLMSRDSNLAVKILKVDGGPTASDYLMQFQADILDSEVSVPELQELSGMGAAYVAGIATGVYNKAELFGHVAYESYKPGMNPVRRKQLYGGWLDAVSRVLCSRRDR